FYGGTGIGPGLAYYYLWHFSAAVFAALPGVGGWPADVALTWFTAFASLSLMMGMAVALGGHRLAAPLALVLSLAASLIPVLRAAIAPDLLDRLLSHAQPPPAWL